MTSGHWYRWLWPQPSAAVPEGTGRDRRWRLFALAAAVVVLGASAAWAYAPAYTCPGIENVGHWQRIPIADFTAIPNVASGDKVTNYSVAATRPELIVATNGKRLEVSTVAGCAWSNGLALSAQPSTDLPLSGTTSTIVATAALPSGRVLAAVREGTGAAARPHIVASEDGRTGYRTYDGGLPPQGAPKLLVAADDGRTLYLVLTPTATDDGPVGGLPLPGLPPVPTTPGGSKAGLLYSSDDGGHSWLLKTSAEDLPAGGGGLDRLAVDHQSPQHLYAISNGLLLNSSNGGRTFERTKLPDGDVTAVESMGPAVVAAFTARGVVALSRDGGHTFTRRPAPAGVTSAAYRAGDGRLAVEADGSLSLIDPSTGNSEPAVGVGVTKDSLLGDVDAASSYHALSSHDLLRYADGSAPPLPELMGADPDFGAPPVPPGVITPAARTVRLRVGSSAVYDYTLAMKISPTPLDLMLLIDAAPSMSPYLADLKQGLPVIVRAITAEGIDLQVGMAAFGTGPKEGVLAVAPPYIDPAHPTDIGSSLYRRYRMVGPVDAGLSAAMASVQSQDEHGDRAQLMGLEQATLGPGVKVPIGPGIVPVYLVPPNHSAAWRPDPGVRRFMVLATDRAFGNPAGSPHRSDGSLDFDQVSLEMRDYEHVHLVGLTAGAAEAHADLATMAGGTRTFAPAGGADCGSGQRLRAGVPLVCDTAADFSAVIGRLIAGLPDLQTVQIGALGATPHVVAPLDVRALRGINVRIPNLVPFSLRVSCVGRSPGRWTEQVAATMRGLAFATTSLIVDCIGPGAAAAERPVPARVPVAPAAAPPVAQAPVPAAPPVPVPVVQLQVQPQPQPQPQVNPVLAAALQRQEQQELVRALADGTDETTLAMVDRRRRDESAALGLLASAMAACTALGLSRLRSRPQPQVVRNRTRGGSRA